MDIKLSHIGRRYNREWIFRHIDFTFRQSESYALLGPNGSGKSTLLKIISGFLSPSEGEVIFFNSKQQRQDIDDVFSEVSYSAPYIDLIDEFSLSELLDFHYSFKSYLAGFDKQRVVEYLGLSSALHKQLKYYSSGMRQRVKLVLACCTDSSLLLLDEPMSNLDTEGEQWCLDLIKQTHTPSRTLIIASNQEKEYFFCTHRIKLSDYKQ